MTFVSIEQKKITILETFHNTWSRVCRNNISPRPSSQQQLTNPMPTDLSNYLWAALLFFWPLPSTTVP